jgi:ABC-type nitrate/sulfonate/bicarbonate transport system substrate-binding protein
MSRWTIALLATALAALWQSPAAAQATKLRYGVIAASARNIESIALYLTQSKGFFAKQGIDLDIVPLPGVEHMVNELDKGNVDVSFTAMPYLINAALKGSDSVGVIGGPANTIYSLIVKPEIKSFDDLKGKTVAVSLPVDTISIATRLLLARHGLHEQDFTAKVLIGTPRRADCLASDACDAAPLVQPNDFVFMSKGYRKLGDTLEVVSVLQFSVIAARRAWAAANRDLVIRFARGYGEAYRFMADPANREELIKIAAARTDATAEVARAVFKFYYEPYRGAMPKQAEISMEGVGKVIELLGVSGALQPPLPLPERFVDLQYLKAAGLQ